MPTPESILEGLATASREAVVLAVAWHALVALGLAALLAGLRPDRRLAALTLAGPLASVALVAWLGGNAFNALVFALVTLAVAGLATWAVPPGPVRAGRPWAAVLGTMLVAFGWVYPHFLDVSPILYLAAAPLGLVPCPTLALVGGIALLLDGLGSRGLTGTLGVASLFYALFGMLVLGVWLDAGLLAGAIGLLVLTAWPRREDVDLRAPA